MTDIPIYLKENFSASILGRLKLKLYETISGRKDWLPDEQEIRRFIRHEFRSKPEIGKLFLFILTKNFIKSTLYAELQEPEDVKQLLIELEKRSLKEAFFLEVKECPPPPPTILGACVYCSALADGGYVYVITLFDDNGFPNYFCGRLEIRASKDHPKPMFSELSGSKFKDYDLRTYKKSPLVVFALKILNYVSQNQRRSLVPLQEVSKIKLKEDNTHRPPEDKTLTALIQSVSIGRVKCTESRVPLSTIQPYDLDFCITYPKETVRWEAREIQKGVESPLLLYWDGKNFIMSDDYAAYLAYRMRGAEDVPVVILGNHPKSLLKKPIKTGGAELIPPLRIRSEGNYDSLSPELKNWLLDERLKRKEQSEVVSNLYVLFMRLSLMLDDPSVKERQLHDFLIKNPTSLDPYGSCILSEVRLGNKYRIDLVIQYKLDEKRILLVELEKASLPIFNKSGRLRSHVTHAIQQVEDWLQWWREQPNEIPKALDSSIPPQGLVVIGRNISLDAQAKRRLLHLNSNRLVKVITYDDLLNRIEALIESLESFGKDRATDK
ncbi:MAG TPA: Shedu immune nuclease family protein [Pyrinomonadaceae bacterium]